MADKRLIIFGTVIVCFILTTLVFAIHQIIFGNEGTELEVLVDAGPGLEVLVDPNDHWTHLVLPYKTAHAIPANQLMEFTVKLKVEDCRIVEVEHSRYAIIVEQSKYTFP